MSRDGDDHLISLIGMMGASSAGGDGEAVNAFRVATRALAKRGITWRDLAIMALQQGAGAEPRRDASEPSRPESQRRRDPYAEQRRQEAEEERERAARRERERRADEARRAEEARREALRRQTEAARRMHTREERRQGVAVPTLVTGRVVVIDDNKGLRMVTLEIEDENNRTVHGPLLAEGDEIRSRVLSCEGRTATLRIRPAHSARFMPRIVACRALRV